MVEQLGDLLALSVPIAGIVLTLCLAALAIYLDYKKKMAMIEKGLVPEDENPNQQIDLGGE